MLLICEINVKMMNNAIKTKEKDGDHQFCFMTKTFLWIFKGCYGINL